MAYNASYSSDDVAPAVIDGITKAFIVFGSMAGLIALVFLYKWTKKAL